MWVVQVNMLIWFPANLAVTVDDPILNLIIPSASLSQVSSSCTTPLYQRSAVYATCDFVGAGTAITGVDVTTLVTFTSSSALVAVVNNYVQVCGAFLHGIGVMQSVAQTCLKTLGRSKCDECQQTTVIVLWGVPHSHVLTLATVLSKAHHRLPSCQLCCRVQDT